MPYALIINGVVDTITFADQPEGWVEVTDDVFAGFLANEDGSFSEPEKSISTFSVDIERDRRINEGFWFSNVKYQARPEDRENIAGAAQVALAAIMNGAQPGDLYWHGRATPFVWIAADNSLNPMDAQTMFDFGKSAMSHKQAMIFKARAIKDMNPIPTDYATNETYWS